jgi:hypothetical protein
MRILSKFKLSHLVDLFKRVSHVRSICCDHAFTNLHALEYQIRLRNTHSSMHISFRHDVYIPLVAGLASRRETLPR